jgi:DNA primase
VTLFEQVKECVTARQAAEHYGIKVKRNGMACCPFHKDKTPSMKIDKRYYYNRY